MLDQLQKTKKRLICAIKNKIATVYLSCLFISLKKKQALAITETLLEEACTDN